MKIARILTSRSFEHNPNYHLIYEWENDLGANLTVPVVDARPLYRKVLIIGKFQSREDYVSLLRASKVSFYSTSGLDGGEQRTGGFNPVTPRFLALLSAQCAARQLPQKGRNGLL